MRHEFELRKLMDYFAGSTLFESEPTNEWYQSSASRVDRGADDASSIGDLALSLLTSHMAIRTFR